MDTVWLTRISNPRTEKPDLTILAGDIGGTHTSLGVVGKTGRSYTLLVKFLFKTKELSSIFDALTPVREAIASNPTLVPVKYCCFSVAGPVSENRCVMTNVDWDIKGLEIESFLDARTLIINDFTALSYALPLLDPSRGDSLLQLPTPEGTLPSPSGHVRAVIGAGTGLGVGFLVEDHGKYLAIPSEGGHSLWPGWGKETFGLAEYIQRTEGMKPESEHVISGPGIVRIYRYLREIQKMQGNVAPLADHAQGDMAAWIASRAKEDPLCGETMKFFVQAYARFAYNIALTTLPFSGLYLAGGIVGKNIDLFTGEQLFYRTFLDTARTAHRELLRRVPLYIIKDYSVSLLGAAHAAYSLL